MKVEGSDPAAAQGWRRLTRPWAWIQTALHVASEPLVVLALVYMSVLFFRLPLLSSLPGWFFPLHEKAIGAQPVVLGLLAAIGTLWLLGRAEWRRGWWTLAALVVLGFGLQHGLAWSEGRGIDGMRDRIAKSGHSEFVVVAAQQPSVWQVMTDYEAKLERGELGRYAHSKPPGQLLFYMGLERFAAGFAKDPGPRARAEAARDLASYTWPLISYLVLIPLFSVLRRLTDEETSFTACALYLVVPSVALITLHTDQVLFPLLAMTVCWLAVRGQQPTRGSWIWATAAGGALYLSAYVSFALLAVAPLAAAVAAAVELDHDADAKLRGHLRALARSGLLAAAGFLGLYVVFALAMGYDMSARMGAAMAYHASWKGWQPGASPRFYFAWINYLEFIVWLGLPLAILGLGRMRRALGEALAGRVRSLVLPALSLALVFFYLGFFGSTKGETARLWIMLVPFCCALAADELRHVYAGRERLMLTVVVVLQWLTVLLTKMRQDFF